MKSKLKKALILSASGLVLLGAGFGLGQSRELQDMIYNAKSHIQAPTTHADSGWSYVGTVSMNSHPHFNLSKRITTKQFTVNNDDDTENTFSELNKKVDKRVDKYLRSVNNLSDYQVYISRTGSIAQNSATENTETATITFIRK